MLQTAGGLEETFFKSLDDMIRHYKRRNQGLAIHLRHSIKRKSGLLINPPKPPIEPPPERPQALPEHLPEEEDHDYESKSHFHCFFFYLSDI